MFIFNSLQAFIYIHVDPCKISANETRVCYDRYVKVTCSHHDLKDRLNGQRLFVSEKAKFVCINTENNFEDIAEEVKGNGTINFVSVQASSKHTFNNKIHFNCSVQYKKGAIEDDRISVDVQNYTAMNDSEKSKLKVPLCIWYTI